MTETRTVMLLAAAAAVCTLAGTAPAEAGRRTGSWKHSPEEIDAQQRQWRWQHRRWQEDRRGGWGEGAYDRPAYRPYYPQQGQGPMAGPIGGPGKYGRE